MICDLATFDLLTDCQIRGEALIFGTSDHLSFSASDSFTNDLASYCNPSEDDYVLREPLEVAYGLQALLNRAQWREALAQGRAPTGDLLAGLRKISNVIIAQRYFHAYAAAWMRAEEAVEAQRNPPPRNLTRMPIKRINDFLNAEFSECNHLADINNCLLKTVFHEGFPLLWTKGRNESALRKSMVAYLEANQQDFVSFWTPGTSRDHYSSYEDAINALNSGWLGDIAIVILSRMLNRPIHLYNCSSPTFSVEDGRAAPTQIFDTWANEKPLTGKPIYLKFINGNHFKPLVKKNA